MLRLSLQAFRALYGCSLRAFNWRGGRGEACKEHAMQPKESLNAGQKA